MFCEAGHSSSIGGESAIVAPLKRGRGPSTGTDEERHAIAYDAAHNLACWPDFPAVLSSSARSTACHNFDLDAAKAQGYKTALVKRPLGWGAVGPPDPEPNPIHDLVVDDFPGLAEALEVSYV